MACLLTRVFTFDHLFNHRSDVFNNLAISLTKWPEYRKNRCLSCSTNSVRLHFRQRAEKTKENGKNTKIENLQNGQEIYGGKKTSVRAHLGKKLKIYIFSSNFSCFHQRNQHSLGHKGHCVQVGGADEFPFHFSCEKDFCAFSLARMLYTVCSLRHLNSSCLQRASLLSSDQYKSHSNDQIDNAITPAIVMLHWRCEPLHLCLPCGVHCPPHVQW